MTDKKKIGMYDETPKVTIGAFTICEMTIPPGDSVWIEEEGVEGAEIQKSQIQPSLKAFFDLLF